MKKTSTIFALLLLLVIVAFAAYFFVRNPRPSSTLEKDMEITDEQRKEIGESSKYAREIQIVTNLMTEADLYYNYQKYNTTGTYNGYCNVADKLNILHTVAIDLEGYVCKALDDKYVAGAILERDGKKISYCTDAALLQQIFLMAEKVVNLGTPNLETISCEYLPQ